MNFGRVIRLENLVLTVINIGVVVTFIVVLVKLFKFLRTGDFRVANLRVGKWTTNES